MRRKSKMNTLLKVLVIVVVSQTVTCESEEASTEVYSIEVDDGRVVVATTEDDIFESTTVIPKNEKDYGKSETVPKPFFYGRKFQITKEDDVSRSEDGKDGLHSPLITNPIRTLSINKSGRESIKFETDPDVIKQNQNDILNSVRDSLYESSDGIFNKTYFEEDVMESENNAEEATEESSTERSIEDSNASLNFNGRSRQDGERSLLVVLPFKASEENMEELFTKSPMVRMVDEDSKDDAEDKQKGAVIVPVGAKEKEIIPATTETVPQTTRKRWRPTRRYQKTTEVVTTTESLKTYTTYNDAEMVTKMYNNPTLPPQNFENHKFEVETLPPYPIQNLKKLRNKTQESTTEGIDFEKLNESVKSKPKRKGLRRKTTTKVPPKEEDLTKVMEILPPDMKDLLLQMGINKESTEQKNVKENLGVVKAPHPSIDPQSYAIFKPLPMELKDENRNFVSDDMKEFLASFGLLPTGTRVQKSLKPPKKQAQPGDLSNVNFDFLPEDLRSVLDDMGLVGQNKSTPTRIHIFNPSNHTIAQSDEDFEKLNAVLNSIKATINESQSLTPEMENDIIEKIKDLKELRYKNGNLSEINEEIQKIIISNKISSKPKITTKRATKFIDGPDPLVFSDESVAKNGVKRQDNNATDATSTAESESTSDASGSPSSSDDSNATTTESTTTTEETPNIEALKESFGGGETASDDADIDSSLPPRRPNGLYLLFDWNSFLEVGTDDDSRRVNIRFQPKVGDSRNFLSVTVP